MQNPENVQQATRFLQTRLGEHGPFPIGVILGTGLGLWESDIQDASTIPYSEIPGFPRSTVDSHSGALIAGTVQGRPVLALSGRFHLYEGYTPADVCMGVRTLAGLGVRNLIVTNAAGALNPQFDAGGLMLITDHINMSGHNPLTGPNHEPWGPRFPDMSRAYSPRLRDLAARAALRLGIRLERGVYIQVPGPSLETPAETRAYRILGADAIGMSTVLEVIAARHLGLDVLGVSCLTNKNLPDCMAETSLEEIIATAQAAADTLGGLLGEIIRDV